MADDRSTGGRDGWRMATRRSPASTRRKASGVAVINAGERSVTATPGLDVTADPLVLLTPRTDLGSRRLRCTTDGTAGTFTIRVSSALAARVAMGWLLLG
jgi:hypothetical protein